MKVDPVRMTTGTTAATAFTFCKCYENLPTDECNWWWLSAWNCNLYYMWSPLFVGVYVCVYVNKIFRNNLVLISDALILQYLLPFNHVNPRIYLLLSPKKINGMFTGCAKWVSRIINSYQYFITMDILRSKSIKTTRFIHFMLDQTFCLQNTKKAMAYQHLL